MPSPVERLTRVASSNNRRFVARTKPTRQRLRTKNAKTHFQRREMHRNTRKPAAILNVVPRTNISEGISANPIARHGQRIALARDLGNTIAPSPAANTSNIDACPSVFGFHVTNVAAFLYSWKLDWMLAELAPMRCT